MVIQFRKWATPPTFDDPERTRIAALVHYLIAISSIVTVVGSILATLIRTQTSPGFVTGLVLVAFQLALVPIIRQGYVRVGAWALVIGLWVSVNVITVLLGGFNAAGVSMFIVVGLIAGMLTDWRGNTLITLASLGALTFFFILQQQQVFFPAILAESPFSILSTTLSSMVAASLVLGLAIYQLKGALKIAAKRQQETEHALQALRQTSVSKVYVDSIINSMLDMLVVVDEHLRIVVVNQSLAARLQYTSDALIGKSLPTILCQANHDLVAQLIPLFQQTDETVSINTCYRTKQGDWVRVEFSASRLRAIGDTHHIVCVAHDVTDRMEAEDTLAVERNLLRTLVDALPDYIHVKDNDGRYILSNAAHMRYCGVTSEDELLGKTSDEAHDDTIVTAYMEDTRMVMASGQPVVQVERKGQNAAGEPVWLQTNKVPLLDANEGISGIVSIATDITQRKRDEERIRESEERLRAVVTNAPVFIFAIDGNHNLTFFEGQGVDEMHIEQVGRMLGKSLFEKATEETADLKIAIAVQQAFTGRSVKSTLRVDALTFDIRYSPMFDLNGEVAGVTGVATDISERVATEDALRESEARNRALLTAIPDFLLVLDAQGNITEFNAPDDDMGIRSDQLVGKNIADLASQINNLAPAQAGFYDCLRTGTPQTIESTFTTKQAGELKSFVLEGRLVQLNKHEVLAVVRDVTVAHRAQAEIQQFAETLARSNAELQEFAYVASHDLQEPLRKIQAFGERLQTRVGDSLSDEDADYLTRMMRAAGRMQNLVQALLMLSRVTTQAKPFEATDLNAVLLEVLEDLELRIEQTHATIQAAELPTIEAEHYQIRQLFLNLIGNALKYSQPNLPPSIIISVTHTQLNSADAVAITIADNGIGFEERYAERIFGVFQRLHSARTYEGTGMGLAICRKIVERHSGTITASGEVNEGAAFTLVLPIQQQHSTGATHEA